MKRVAGEELSRPVWLQLQFQDGKELKVEESNGKSPISYHSPMFAQMLQSLCNESTNMHLPLPELLLDM
jgi:hypothetical protein